VVLAAALLVALTFIFEHVYGELVSQVVLTYAANRFGITGEHLVASLAPHVVFGSLAAFLLLLRIVWPIGISLKRYLQKTHMTTHWRLHQ
jgi:hypothetical protein